MTIANTFQGQAPPPAGTGGAELAIERLVGVSAGSLTGRATDGPGVEFEGFIGPWNIDLTDDSVSFISVTGRAKPPFPGFFRVFEPGTFDRYYIAFDKPVEAEEITVCRQFVTAEFSSATQLVVTIGRATTTLA